MFARTLVLQSKKAVKRAVVQPTLFGGLSPFANFITKFDFPSFGLKEDGDRLTAEIKHPGIKKDNIDLDLSYDTLTIHGSTHQIADEGSSHSSSFVRTFSVPRGLQRDEIKAVLLEDEGVLTVSFPREPKDAAKQIEIEVEKSGEAVEEGGANGDGIGEGGEKAEEGVKA